MEIADNTVHHPHHSRPQRHTITSSHFRLFRSSVRKHHHQFLTAVILAICVLRTPRTIFQGHGFNSPHTGRNYRHHSKNSIIRNQQNSQSQHQGYRLNRYPARLSLASLPTNGRLIHPVQNVEYTITPSREHGRELSVTTSKLHQPPTDVMCGRIFMSLDLVIGSWTVRLFSAPRLAKYTNRSKVSYFIM
jgi:hypothetical protein